MGAHTSVTYANTRSADAGDDARSRLREDRPGPAARLRLLGGFALACGSDEVLLPLGAQRLVAFLALQPGAVTRPYVAGSLWLDVSEERAAANLRSAIWRLNGAPTEIVESTRTHLRLDPGIAVDHRRALEMAHRMLDPDIDDETTLDVGFGDLLPDWYDEWVTIERERFRSLRLNALEQLCGKLARRGRLGEAIDVGFAVVAAEPLRESAHRQLISIHLHAGNWWDALRQYETYRVVLLEELGLTPSDEMEALIAPLRSRSSGARLDLPVRPALR